LNEQKKDALELNKKAIQYGVLKRENESNKDLYDVFLTRLKETDLSKEIQSSNIRILDRAKTPESPFKPRKKLNISIAMVVGLMMGLGFAFIGEYMDSSLKTPEEIEGHLDIPSLGIINIAEKYDLVLGDLIVRDSPKSRINERLLAVRTNTVFSFSGDVSRTLMVTSSFPLEGKSFIAKNLAASLANMNKKVLLVDADMRRPSLHRTFNIDPSPGLSEILVGEASIEEAIKDTTEANLRLLPSGTIPPNPLDLIGSERMMELVETLKQHYRWIIFDTPPLINVSDAAMLCGSGVSVLFVIKFGVFKKDEIKQAVKQLKKINAKVIGAVLNFVDYKKERYYYGYYHKYYDYYYDEEGNKKGRKKQDILS